MPAQVLGVCGPSPVSLLATRGFIQSNPDEFCHAATLFTEYTVSFAGYAYMAPASPWCCVWLQQSLSGNKQSCAVHILPISRPSHDSAIETNTMVQKGIILPN